MHLLLNVIVALILILTSARIMARVAVLLRFPSVIGEMVAGILLGPTCFMYFFPEISKSVFNADVGNVIYILSNFGLCLYMLLVGMEMKGIDRKSFRQAGLLASSGIIPPFLLGGGISLFLYASLAQQQITQLEFFLYMGVALSITSIPMLARILEEQGLLQSRFASLTLLAGSIDDVISWCILAVVIVMVQAKNMFSGISTLLYTVLFVLIVLFVVKPLMERFGAKVQKAGFLSHGGLALVLLLTLGASFVTEYIGIYAVFGCFILGLAMPRSEVFLNEMNIKIRDITVVFFLPLYFAYSGMKTNLLDLFSADMLFPFFILLLCSILGKYGGCTLYMRKIGFSWREASAVGGLMNARGLMELVVINIGMTYGIITPKLYAMLVLMALVTTALAMPIYYFSMGTKSRTASAVFPPKIQYRAEDGG
ncbi:cation:proton antiporter [Paenibacillus chitinolyticus]|uniref:cation:proton antiporter n=1 Tax=Paenibacillus chitinolyticus TaxID=79263 RepID=UPI002DBC7ADC|nr:cation:proton antiporter [Paenibacillus chitinolyticus]MEC0248070.1 cation:proton antiporter [Paenibacillus chitinolyticus]